MKYLGITIIVSTLLIMMYLQSEMGRKIKLLEEHTNICGETLKAQQYQIDVLTDLIRVK